MKRTRSVTRLAALGLIALAACQTDPTSPDGDDPDGPMGPPHDLIMARITAIETAHDCDPNNENPGDFVGWIEVWQDIDPAADVAEFALVAESDKRTVSLNSGERADVGNTMRINGTLTRLASRPVSVRSYVRELDGVAIDIAIDQSNTIVWAAEDDCWTQHGPCLGPAGSGLYDAEWSHGRTSREDVFNLFNPDDEGCALHVEYEAVITEADE